MSRKHRQEALARWALREFGELEAQSPKQRTLRLLEEAIELGQVAGCEPNMIKALVDFIYLKEPGTYETEIGDLEVCTLLVAESVNLSAEECEINTTIKLLSRPIGFHSKRNKKKNNAGFKAI